MTPPVALRPNSVPCGPRNTSTRSMSIALSKLPELCPIYISSNTTPTAGSTDFSTSATPMPRIYTAATPPGPCCVSSITMLGEAPAKSRTSESKRFSSSPADNALTDAGTSCMFSSRLRAVTRISSRPPDSACVSMADSCALASDAGYIAIAAVVSSRAIFTRSIMNIPPPKVGVCFARHTLCGCRGLRSNFRMPHLFAIDKQILLEVAFLCSKYFLYICFI